MKYMVFSLEGGEGMPSFRQLYRMNSHYFK